MAGPWDDYAQAAPWQDYAGTAVKPMDKYQLAALEEYNAGKAAGSPVDGMAGGSLARKVLQGATFGGADEVTAALLTPFEMIKRGTLDPREGYNYAKAAENLHLQQATDKTGALGTAAEIAGGIGSGTGLANAGATLVKAGQGFLPRVGAMMGEGTAYGGLTGALSEDGTDRLGGAAKGAALGAGVGAAIPLVGGAIGTAAAPIASNIMARIDPAGSARARLARGLQESGRSADDVGRAVQDAAAQGQPVFTVADALGNPGQRLMSTVTRAPGEGRTAAVDFLDGRQAMQGRRTSTALSEALGVEDTAQQATARLTSERAADAGANYGAARSSASSVDVGPAIAAADRNLPPGFDPLGGAGQIPRDTVTGIIARARGMLTNGEDTLTNFNSALQTKIDLDSIIEKATGPQQHALSQVRNALDDQLARASAPYARARDTFAHQSRGIDAVQQGRTAAMRGRAEDTIPRFEGLHPDHQAPFRTGYADPVLEQIQNSAVGVNKVRPLLAEGPQAELSALSLHNGPYLPNQPDRLAAQLARENTMFETRAAAMGGSKTADNLADQAHAGVDPRIFGNLLTGHFGAAATNLMHGAANGLTGNTPAVRHELAKLLMSRGVDPQLGQMLNTVQGQLASKQALAAALMRGAAQGEGEAVGQRR